MENPTCMTQSKLSFVKPCVLYVCLAAVSGGVNVQAYAWNCDPGLENAPSITASVDSNALAKEEKVRKKFLGLVEQWRSDRGSTSAFEEIVSIPAYQKIIGMGVTSIPLIIEQIKSEGDDPDQWFWALSTISEANDLPLPEIPNDAEGNFAKLAKIWLGWAEKQGYAV